jgi:hypothetical protein
MKRVLSCLLILGGFTSFAYSKDPAKPRIGVFDAVHELKIKVPNGAKRVSAWFTVPQEESHQKVASFKVESPVPYRMEREKTEGSRFLFIDADVSELKSNELKLVTTFRLTREEVRRDLKSARGGKISAIDKAKMQRYLEADENVIIDDRVRKLAAEIVGNETSTVAAARRIYDYVLQYADYWVIEPATKKASPVGSTEYCLATRTGNCTDFHSLWTSLARAAGIPTRIVYGSFFKKELDGQDVDQSYHCWTEFYDPRLAWISQDVAVADLFAQEIKLDEQNRTLVQRTTPAGYFGKDMKLVDYYFGNLDERRVVWSVGRDLELSPRQAAGPVNAIAKAYVEIDGAVAKEGASADWVRKLTFREVKNVAAK